MKNIGIKSLIKTITAYTLEYTTLIKNKSFMKLILAGFISFFLAVKSVTLHYYVKCILYLMVKLQT